MNMIKYVNHLKSMTFLISFLNSLKIVYSDLKLTEIMIFDVWNLIFVKLMLNYMLC